MKFYHFYNNLWRLQTWRFVIPRTHIFWKIWQASLTNSYDSTLILKISFETNLSQRKMAFWIFKIALGFGRLSPYKHWDPIFWFLQLSDQNLIEIRTDLNFMRKLSSTAFHPMVFIEIELHPIYSILWKNSFVKIVICVRLSSCVHYMCNVHEHVPISQN